MEKMNKFKTMTTKQKYDYIWNIFFGILLIPTSIGIYFLFHDTKTSDAESTAQMPKSEKAGAGILVHLLCIEL